MDKVIKVTIVLEDYFLKNWSESFIDFFYLVIIKENVLYII
jgi:hypothetical protein